MNVFQLGALTCENIMKLFPPVTALLVVNFAAIAGNFKFTSVLYCEFCL